MHNIIIMKVDGLGQSDLCFLQGENSPRLRRPSAGVVYRVAFRSSCIRTRGFESHGGHSFFFPNAFGYGMILIPGINSRFSWVRIPPCTNTFFLPNAFYVLVLYKVPLQDGADLISRGGRKSNRENTGVPMIFISYVLPGTAFAAAVYFVYLV